MMKKELIFFINTCLLVLLLSSCEQQTPQNMVVLKPLASTATEKVALVSANQENIDLIAQTLSVNYRLLTNIPDQDCDSTKSSGRCFLAELVFTAKSPIKSKDWAIYFSHISPVQSSISNEFTLTHLNGDLHKISLTKNYSGFKKGEIKRIKFRANYWMLAESDAIPNYIVAATHNNNIQAKVIASTKPIIDPQTGLEKLPFVEPFTDYSKQFQRTEKDKTQWLNSATLFQRNTKTLANKQLNTSQQLIPTPKHIRYDSQNRFLHLTQGINVNFAQVNRDDVNAALVHLASLGVPQNPAGIPVNLSIKANKKLPKGSYQLTVSEKEISINGVDAAGVYYGLSSLASLLNFTDKSVPLVTIEDQPYYQFRGMLIDVARNFHSKAFILKLLDQMAAYKLNKLHLHLGDDEGWRLEIPELPELTTIGSKRCFDLTEQRCLLPQLGAGVDSNSAVNGFYSVADYQEILRAASARHIQVIPSLDMPGHARAAIKAMQARYHHYQKLGKEKQAKQYLLHDPKDKTNYLSVQYYKDNTINVCLESTYRFIETVMKSVKRIHQQANHPLTRYHIGADETAGAWLESPACKAFIADKANGVNDIKELGAYFIERVAHILSTLNIETAGWSDGLAHTRTAKMPEIVQVNAWDTLFWQGHKKAHELANRHWQVVLSSPDVLYFDFPYEADPKEHGYYWASRHTNTEKVFQFMPDNLPIHAKFWRDRQELPYSAHDVVEKNAQGEVIASPLQQGKKFIGIQGQLWSEITRTDHMAEYKIYPRLFALAERAWHSPSWAVPYNYQGASYDQNSHVFSPEQQALHNEKWQLFANTIGQKALIKLEQANIHYRLPTVGAIIKKGILSANISFPGLIIEFQQEGKAWQKYQAPTPVQGSVKVRARSFDGKRYGRSTYVSEL